MAPLDETDKTIQDHDERILRLESEILGDALAGRPSLRQDMEKSMKGLRKIMFVILATLLTMLATLVVNSLRQPVAQAQEQHRPLEK